MLSFADLMNLIHEYSQYNIKTKEKSKTHSLFLHNLAKVLDKDCKPIVVSDAGLNNWGQVKIKRPCNKICVTAYH